ncbi:MAG TPA: DUF4924 family protein [Crocinitomicaceae bacterium]|nr:DUF4924 family protein [Crocinitomicaceae bacterium]
MLVAEQKKSSNIAEYILYMYQVEDVIRAYNLDLDAIMENYVKPQLPDESFLGQYRKWYNSLILQMRSEKIEKKGHLLSIQEVLVELSYLHNTLLNLTDNDKYKDIFGVAGPHIEEFRLKSDLKDKNSIEIAFNALYMKLLLRLQKKEISPASEEAFDSMRVMLAFLSRSYVQMKKGDLDFLNN